MKSVSFLPIIPNPVTEHRMVYTALKNLVEVSHKLTQSHLPVACDEGVYCIACEIKMLRSDEFSKIVLYMGSFHMIKVVLSYLGKYL